MDAKFMNYPPVTIVATTYFPEGMDGMLRQKIFSETLYSWDANLKYTGEIRLHISDDGSVGYGRPTYFRNNLVSYSSQNRHGVGASLNKGFREAFRTSSLVLYLADDWSLTFPFDLTPWAQLLIEREDIGEVRLGPPHPGITGTAEALTENWNGWGLRLDRHHFVAAHRPVLIHKRFLDSYGWFEEDTSSLECERLYSVKFNTQKGPDIVLALPHPWQHLDSVELAYIDPKGI